jgi:hypothetical protein
MTTPSPGEDRRLVGRIDWDAVAALAAESYRLVAPKRLAALARAGRS